MVSQLSDVLRLRLTAVGEGVIVTETDHQENLVFLPLLPPPLKPSKEVLRRECLDGSAGGVR